MGVVQGAAVMLGSWLRSNRSHTSSTPSALATYITPACTSCQLEPHWVSSERLTASNQGAACGLICSCG